ncbi:hypothetical protein CJ030_MR6G011337 [Morella rubra]|uniref:Uncharacterized protein n=1 Tax=Morella rubra TaxID=262757 RepID=A0A6A1VE37_9ROSI|nr:hypothetical protein CJ030_MR6G011337 [Morella rubra]
MELAFTKPSFSIGLQRIALSVQHSVQVSASGVSETQFIGTRVLKTIPLDMGIAQSDGAELANVPLEDVATSFLGANRTTNHLIGGEFMKVSDVEKRKILRSSSRIDNGDRSERGRDRYRKHTRGRKTPNHGNSAHNPKEMPLPGSDHSGGFDPGSPSPELSLLALLAKDSLSKKRS